jgi:3,4-dihydroxy 2-butanone 4-phosphate synthase/GTP cyclohydrolase II
VLIDDLSAERSVTFVAAAGCISPALVVQLLRHTNGMLGVTLARDRLTQLRIPLWCSSLSGRTVARSVVAIGPRERHSVATRTATIAALADGDTTSDRLASPGCVFPIPTEPETLLLEPRSSDAAAALVALATGAPVAVCAPVLGEDQLEVPHHAAVAWAEGHRYDVVWASDVVVEHCRRRPTARREASARFPTAIDPAFQLTAYTGPGAVTHLALRIGALRETDRVFAVDECRLSPFRVLSCPCSVRLDSAMRMIADAGAGLVIYLRADDGALCPEVRSVGADRSLAGIVRAFTIAAIRDDQLGGAGVA